MKNPFQKTLIKLSNWNYVLEVSENHVNNSFDNYLRTFNNLAIHGTIEKPEKQEKKFPQISWITSGIQKFLKKKNELFKKYTKH